jgi:hypothetical protein
VIYQKEWKQATYLAFVDWYLDRPNDLLLNGRIHQLQFVVHPKPSLSSDAESNLVLAVNRTSEQRVKLGKVMHTKSRMVKVVHVHVGEVVGVDTGWFGGLSSIRGDGNVEEVETFFAVQSGEWGIKNGKILWNIAPESVW